MLNSFCLIVNSHIIEDHSKVKNFINNDSPHLINGSHHIFLQYNIMDVIDLLKSEIHTTCNGFEKTSETFFAISNEINVDGNDNTGVNGNDIIIQYLLLPWIDIDPELKTLPGIQASYRRRARRLRQDFTTGRSGTPDRAADLLVCSRYPGSGSPTLYRPLHRGHRQSLPQLWAAIVGSPTE